METRKQENLRALLQLSCIGVNILNHIINGNATSPEELNKILYDTNIISLTLFDIDVVLANRYTRKADDYKELEKLYKQVISNTVNLMKEFGFENPAEIFATYVYLYRNGYLSNNKYFEYNTNMKDFHHMIGLDVVRGTGVCRSIASMLNDIYHEYGYQSTALSVVTSDETQIAIKEHSINKPMNVSSKGKFFSGVIGKVTNIIPISNHVITACEKDGINYIFDPTADGLLYNIDYKKLVVAENDIHRMKIGYVINKFDRLIGMYPKDVKSKELLKQLELPTITTEYYRKLSSTTKSVLDVNKDVLDTFYDTNKELYEEIDEKSNTKRGYLKRMLPIIPHK